MRRSSKQAVRPVTISYLSLRICIFSLFQQLLFTLHKTNLQKLRSFTLVIEWTPQNISVSWKCWHVNFQSKHYTWGKIVNLCDCWSFLLQFLLVTSLILNFFLSAHLCLYYCHCVQQQCRFICVFEWTQSHDSLHSHLRNIYIQPQNSRVSPNNGLFKNKVTKCSFARAKFSSVVVKKP